LLRNLHRRKKIFFFFMMWSWSKIYKNGLLITTHTYIHTCVHTYLCSYDVCMYVPVQGRPRPIMSVTVITYAPSVTVHRDGLQAWAQPSLNLGAGPRAPGDKLWKHYGCVSVLCGCPWPPQNIFFVSARTNRRHHHHHSFSTTCTLVFPSAILNLGVRSDLLTESVESVTMSFVDAKSCQELYARCTWAK